MDCNRVIQISNTKSLKLKKDKIINYLLITIIIYKYIIFIKDNKIIFKQTVVTDTV